jgi:hypothetical protein
LQNGCFGMIEVGQTQHVLGLATVRFMFRWHGSGLPNRRSMICPVFAFLPQCPFFANRNARMFCMAIPWTVKRVSFVLAAFLVFGGGIALLGWKLIQHRIALNAHAPRLVSVPEPGVDLPFRTLEGEPKHLSELKGKVVFLDLWGTWCIQCVAEMPGLTSNRPALCTTQSS